MTPDDIPVRMKELWGWVCALYAWDHGDTYPLELLICAGPIPPEFLKAVSDVVGGRRQQKKKAAVKMKMPVGVRLNIAMRLIFDQGTTESLIKKFTHASVDGQGLDAIADYLAVEPAQAKSCLFGIKNFRLSQLASQYGVSERAMDDLRREFEDKVRKWPCM